MNDQVFNLDRYLEMALDFAPQLLLALFVLVVGWRIVNWISRRLDHLLARREMDDAIRPFLVSLASILLKVLLLFSVAEMVGIKTASFIAIMAAAGFAIGMAMQGSLSNFAAGVMILFFKPYKIGDIIEVGDWKGKVSSIQIFNTIMVTPKNETVIVPNSTAIADKIINHSTIGNVRVDLYFHIPYEEDYHKVRDIVMGLADAHPKVLKDPRGSVDIEAYDTHNIQIGVFLFCAPDDYWTVFYEMNNVIKPALGQHGIKVAYSEGIELGSISDG